VTDRGTVRTDTVICAAGAWSQQVAQLAGVHLRSRPCADRWWSPRRAGPADDLPFTIDFATSFYFHGEGRGLLMGMSDPDEQPGFQLERSDAWLPRLGDAVARRAPRLVDVGLRSGWAGLYEMTPDHNALIGEVQGVSRFLYATGFSGHGFLMGPAVGEVVRDLFLGRQPPVDVTGLSVDRLTADNLRPESNVV
jgi:sarcosine oxidase subunit beta